MKPLEPLINLFGYLHEDWALEYGDAWDAVDCFARDEPAYAPLVRSDIELVVDLFATEPELQHGLLSLGLAYRPGADGWTSHRTWLLAVADGVDRVRAGSIAGP